MSFMASVGRVLRNPYVETVMRHSRTASKTYAQIAMASRGIPPGAMIPPGHLPVFLKGVVELYLNKIIAKFAKKKPPLSRESREEIIKEIDEIDINGALDTKTLPKLKETLEKAKKSKQD